MWYQLPVWLIESQGLQRGQDAEQYGLWDIWRVQIRSIWKLQKGNYFGDEEQSVGRHELELEHSIWFYEEFRNFSEIF